MQECRLQPRPQDLYTSTSETVKPTVLLGDPLTGSGGDSTRTAFAKFNEHEHLPAGSVSFQASGIKAGNPIQIFNIQGLPILPEGAVVTASLSLRLEINLPAVVTQRRGVALVQTDRGSVVIPNVVVFQGQTTVTREERSGTVEGRWLQQLATETLSQTWFEPPSGLHTLCLRLPYSAVLDTVWLQTTRGRGLASLQINDQMPFPEWNVKQTTTAWRPSEPFFIPLGSRLRLQLRDLVDFGNLSISLTLIKELS